jgi:phage gpG-like protein
MNMTFTWPAGPTSQVRQTLRAPGIAIRDLRPVWKRFVITLRTRHRQTFDRMADPFTSAAWTPLDEDYALTKPAGTQKKILYRTGRLRKSLTTGGKSADSIIIIEPKQMTFGTAVPYGIFHQATDRSRKDGASLMRRFIGMKLPDDLEILMKFVKTHIVSMAARARRGSVYA